jgi:DUF971 family protein
MLLPETLLNDPIGGVLEIIWPDGVRQCLSHRSLRSRCRCAECCSKRLHRNAAAPVSPRVKVVAIEPVGHYAIQLFFSDGHNRGVFPWPMLRAFDTV